MRLREPFRISGYLFEAMPAVVVEIGDGRVTGRGEAAGVYYLDDDTAHMELAIEAVRSAVEAGASRQDLRTLLPAGGARNALDCAMWERESLASGTPVAQLAGLGNPRPLVTTFTVPAVDPGEVESRLAALDHAQSLKLKLEGDLDVDAERLREVRRLRPETWLAVDANQGFHRDDLDRLAALLSEMRVSLLEQPVRRGSERELEGWKCPIPIAADESILDLNELAERHQHFDVINLKLDKCGGLTEALMMAAEIRKLGKQIMVGNMAGSFLAAAPGFILGQLCEVVDLDGPFFLVDQSAPDVIYKDGMIDVPAGMWGAGTNGPNTNLADQPDSRS